METRTVIGWVYLDEPNWWQAALFGGLGVVIAVLAVTMTVRLVKSYARVKVPSVEPNATPAIPPTHCTNTFANAANGRPSWISVKVSSPNVENVVKPPRIPTYTNVRAVRLMRICPLTRSPVIVPMITQPTRLTVPVATGTS